MKEKINFSNFKNYALFYSKSYTSDDLGGFSISKTKVYESWGWLKPIEPNVKSRKANINRLWTHRMVMRFDEAVNVGQLVEYDGRWFVIDFLLRHNEDDLYLELMLIEQGGMNGNSPN
jgi:hypothetical protein